eukprot:GILK01003459.1.p1 GENE.GILK01003459.1~~GILK01003459.1.p1  ORF type:complete len:226 (-),score=25.17 GILK01003459.1:407-1084(-)
MVFVRKDVADDECHFALKICVFGDGRVGKSAFVEALSSGSTNSDFGVADGSTQITSIHCEEDACIYNVQFWSTPGAERYLRLASRISAGCAAAIFVFDVTNRTSFEHVDDWMKEVEKHQTMPKILVGNKHDLRVVGRVSDVTSEQAEEFARKHDMLYFETSAVQQSGVSAAFQQLFSDIVCAIPNPPEPSLLLRKGIKLGRGLTSNPRYRQALFAPATSTAVDWL